MSKDCLKVWIRDEAVDRSLESLAAHLGIRVLFHNSRSVIDLSLNTFHHSGQLGLSATANLVRADLRQGFDIPSAINVVLGYGEHLDMRGRLQKAYITVVSLIRLLHTGGIVVTQSEDDVEHVALDIGDLAGMRLDARRSPCDLRGRGQDRVALHYMMGLSRRDMVHLSPGHAAARERADVHRVGGFLGLLNPIQLHVHPHGGGGL